MTYFRLFHFTIQCTLPSSPPPAAFPLLTSRTLTFPRKTTFGSMLLSPPYFDCVLSYFLFGNILCHDPLGCQVDIKNETEPREGSPGLCKLPKLSSSGSPLEGVRATELLTEWTRQALPAYTNKRRHCMLNQQPEMRPSRTG